MDVNDRVRLNDDERWPTLGTVTKVSPMGYVTVEWDQLVIEPNLFSPNRVSQFLTVVTGDDAKPRHRWFSTNEDFTSCEKCFVQQTEANDLEPCTP